MAATPSNPTNYASLEEISQAAESWAKKAISATDAYAKLAARIAKDLPAALVQAGLDVNAATDMAEELRIDVSNLATGFQDVANLAEAIMSTRVDILELVAKAKQNASERTFRIGA